MSSNSLVNTLTKTSLVVTFLLFSGVVFATGGDEKKRSKETEISIQQQGDKKKSIENLDISEANDEAKDMESQNVDSADDDSVSKYNFIFYFLYKFKYNEEEALDVF